MNKKKLLFSISFFIGWFLTFSYNSPLIHLIIDIEIYKKIFFLISIFVIPIILFGIMLKLKIIPKIKNIFSISIVVCILSSAIILIFSKSIINILNYIIILMASSLIGLASLYILYVMINSFNDLYEYKDTFTFMAKIILISYSIFFITNSLLILSPKTAIFFCYIWLFIAFLLSLNIKLTSEKHNQSIIKLNIKYLAIFCLVVFLLNFGNGIIQYFYKKLFNLSSYFQLSSIILTYVLVSIIFLVLKKKTTRIKLLLLISCFLCVIGLMFFLSNHFFVIFIQLGFAIIDILI